MKMKETSRDKDKKPYGNNKLFLNPERKSMPDIDVDFNIDIREKCFEYCAKKYGKDNVCRIMTKAYQASKGSIRWAARFLAAKETYSYKDTMLKAEYKIKDNEITKKWNNIADSLCKLIDQKAKDRLAKDKNNQVEINKETLNNNNFEDIIDDGEEIKDEEIIDDGSLNSLMYSEGLTQEDKECIDTAISINGLYTNDGEHACGYIISKDNLSNIIPIKYNSKLNNMSTQCNMAQAESLGLLKMDFLNLKNLTIITEILKETNDDRLQNYLIRDVILNDKDVFKHIYCSGNTLGVFQFESPGMTKMLKELQPDCFEDIIAAISLYRPGPMDFIPQYIEGKHHPEKVVYKCEALKNILSPTYGTIVYQEQVMQIFQAVGYTLGGADTIRKAMSKKHEEEIEAERDNFIYGNEERHIDGAIKAFGMTAEEATELFDVMKKFGRYAFNKSHATAYAMVSLFTAFLKEYHPAEFYKYTLRHLPTDKRNKQMASYIKEMKLFGIEMEAPSLEIGNMEFELSADKKHLYFGLSDIKGMQEFTIKNKTTCLQDFVANNLNITQSILITLAKIGAFDTQWNGDTKKVSCEEALKWIEINKERYDKLAALKDKINTIITSYSNFLEDKEKNKMINNYNKYKTEYKIILQEIKDYYDETKKNPSKENSLIKYENQKKLCYYPISCKENLPFLQRENTVDFSVLNSDDGRTSHTIDVIIVDISEPLKTKTSNKTYYNVGLMDKTGNVITRRFEQPPTTLTARVNIPNERFFNCSIVKKIAKKNNTKELSAKELVEKVIDNELPLNNINENYVRINGNSKTVFTITEDKEIER